MLEAIKSKEIINIRLILSENSVEEMDWTNVASQKKSAKFIRLLNYKKREVQ